MSARFVALLRGINVGGKNPLPMKELAAIFTAAGARDVRTYIQSGNVIFGATEALARKLPKLIPRAIEARFGHAPPVIVRSEAELTRIVAENPWLARGAKPDELHVVFLAARPTASRTAALDPDRSPPDAFELRGQEIFLRCPKGLGRSKLTNAWFDSALATTSTMRNWRTVNQLLSLARG